MSNLTKLGIAAAMIFVATTVVRANNTTTLYSKFKINPLLPNNIGISKGLLNINFPVQVINQTNYSVKLTNLYVSVSYKDSLGNWQDLFFQPNAIKELELAAGAPTNLNTIPLSMQLTNALNLVDIFSGKLSRTLRFSVRFQVAGVEVSPIVTDIDANSYLAPIIGYLKRFGLAGNLETLFGELPVYHPYDFGYSGFHSRKIKDASAYSHLISPSKNTTSVVRKDGSAYDTIDDMAKVVGETLYQTKQLAAKLKGKDTEQTIKNIWTWLHDHIQYNRDKDGEEQLREPSRSFADRKTGIDCDCFSIFASSLLTNSGIPHYIEMCQIKPDAWFKHVYVVVPKKENISMDQRSNYWVVDACLHNFDELAPNITLKYNRPMYTTRLAGLDQSAAGKPVNCSCPPKKAGTFGVKKVSAIPNSANANELELQILEPMRQNLIRTRSEALSRPATVAMLYNPTKLVQAIDYALANWSNPVTRPQALEILANQDESLVNRPSVNGLMGIGAFRGLDGVDYDPTQSHPMLGIDGDGNLMLEGFGGVFSSLKKAASSVKNVVKNIQTKAVETVKAGAQKAGTALKVTKTAMDKAATAVKTGVVNAAKFVAQNVQKVNPAMVVSRTAYRGLLALNFRGMASDLAKIIATTEGEKKVRDFWTGNFIGGNWGDLISAVNAGKAKPHMLGGLDAGFGVVVATATASSVAAASPIIIKISELIKSALKTSEKIVAVKDKVSAIKQTVHSFLPSNPNKTAEQPIQIQDVNPTIAIQNPSAPPSEYVSVAPAQPKNNTLLYVFGAAAVAAIAFALSGNKNNHQLKGIPSYTI